MEGQEHRPFANPAIFEPDATQMPIEVLARAAAGRRKGLIANQTCVALERMRITTQGDEIETRHHKRGFGRVREMAAPRFSISRSPEIPQAPRAKRQRHGCLRTRGAAARLAGRASRCACPASIPALGGNV